jgi:hypothetical protein
VYTSAHLSWGVVSKQHGEALMALNKSRILLGGFVGGIVWNAWSFFTYTRVASGYTAMQNAGLFLKQPRYPAFQAQWIVILFVMSFVVAYLYASVRATLGPGPKTALKLGLLAGFLAGFPDNFAAATWSALPRIFPLAWMLEMWIGATLATLVAGALYKDA